MKKQCFALAALCALAGTAHAQSSVTLYGIIDEGIDYQSNANGHPSWSMLGGVMSGSRFGMRGAEDLGGGAKAIFVLENGFNPSNGGFGQGGLMFGRQAYVGLSSANYGTITLGRQYDSVVDYVGPLEAGDQWGGYIAAHPGDLDNFNNAYRANNTVKFTSAKYAGLTFGGTYSLGGQAGNFTGNQIWSLGAGYSNGPLTLGAAYLNARTPAAPGGMLNNSGTVVASPGNPLSSTPVYGGYASANTWQVVGLGGAYTYGAATFGATYSNIKFMNLGSVAVTGTPHYTGTATLNNAELNFKYQITPALLVGAAFDYTDGGSVTLANGTTNGGAKYYQGALGVDYFLSKRTDVYVIGIYQHASGTDSTGAPARASINLLTASSSDNQSTVRIGIRQKF
jgi:predicted porin